MTGSDWLLIGGTFVWIIYVWLVLIPLWQQTRKDRADHRRQLLNRTMGQPR